MTFLDISNNYIDNDLYDKLDIFLNFNKKHGIIHDKDINDIKQSFNNMYTYTFNNTVNAYDIIYILDNINTINLDIYKNITILKKPLDYICNYYENQKHVIVFKYNKSVFKFIDISYDNKVFDLILETHFYKILNVYNDHPNIIIPKLYNYGIVINGDQKLIYLETEFVENLIDEHFLLTNNSNYIKNIILEFVHKYKSANNFMNSNNFFFIDDFKNKNFIFNLTNPSEDFDREDMYLFLRKCGLTVSDKYSDKPIFHPNIYFSNTKKIVFIDFDCISRKKMTKSFFLYLFKNMTPY